MTNNTRKNLQTIMRRHRFQHAPPDARNGVTLIELLVVITLFSTIFLLFGSVLFRVYRQQTWLTVATHQSRTWLQLARALRSDLHAASTVSWQGDERSELMLTAGGDSIRWAITDAEVQRFVISGDAQEATSRERFVLPNTRLKFELIQSEQQQLARLTATATPLIDSSLPPSSGVIESAIGINRRWEGGLP